MSLTYALYNGIYVFCWNLFYPYLRWVRGREEEYIKARFTPPSLPEKRKKRVWIHAVSVGETNVALILGKEIEKVLSDWEVVISTSTPTGYKNLQRKNLFPCFLAPWDRRDVVRRFVESVKMDKLVIVETELWPALIRESKEVGAGVFIVNARISDRAYKRYKWIKGFLKKEVLVFVDKILCQDLLAVERFITLGGRDVEVCGNVKYDVRMEEQELGKWERELRGRFVVILGSTHMGEEESLVRRIKKRDDLFLIVAPRHPERSRQVKEVIERMGYKVELLSSVEEKGKVSGNALVVDKIGVLAQIYRLASVVFVGGSLVPKGGQNPLEPAYWGRPIVFGPHMENFHEISTGLLAEGGAIQVRSSEEFADLLQQDLTRVGRRAREFLEKKRGAVNCILRKVFGEEI